jgi:uncharacterized protein
MRIFFTTDVHASDRCFRKFLNAARFYKVDALILGGDITGKVLVPMVEREDGRYSFSKFGHEVIIGRDKLEENQKALADAGQYSFVARQSEIEEMTASKDKKDAVFRECMRRSIASWLSLAEERLAGTHVKCYISPGNDDVFEIDTLLTDSGHLVNPENRVVELGDNEMMTLGYANPTPWRSPREVSEEELGRMIGALADQVQKPETAVYNLHVPPIDTELDKAPAVDEGFNYVKDGLGIKVIHVGSSAVRAAIEKNQPLLGLHGHIHESRGFARIGRTLCLNPGSEYADGILRGAIVNLSEGKVKEFLLTSG